MSDELPSFWKEIQNYPKQVRLFAFVAAVSMHYSLLKLLARFSSKSSMTGTYKYEPNTKVSTNLKVLWSCQVQLYKIIEEKKEVPYTLATLFEDGNVGLLAKELFINRLCVIGYNEAELVADQELFLGSL